MKNAIYKICALGLSLIMCFIISACNGAFVAQDLELGSTDQPIPVVGDFSSAKAVIQSSCVGCHSAGGSAAYLPLNLNTEDEFLAAGHVVKGKPLESNLIKRLRHYGAVNSNMPPAHMNFSVQDYNKIVNWVRNITSNTTQTFGEYTCAVDADPKPDRMLRLKKQEFIKTLNSILAMTEWYLVTTVEANQELTSLLGLIPEDHGGENYNSFDQTISIEHVESYYKTIERYATLLTTPHASGPVSRIRQIVANFSPIAGGLAARPAGDCALYNTPATENCYRNFIKAFALASHRRTLTDEEINFYFSKLNLIESKEVIQRRLIIAMLSAPDFIFRMESHGVSEPLMANYKKLSPFEIATRLSYTFWGDMPDLTLFNMASSGNIATDAGFQLAIDHVFSTTNQIKVKNTLKSFYGDYLHFSKIPKLNAFSTPEFSNFAAGENINNVGFNHRTDMINEIYDMFDYYTWTAPSDFSEVLKSRKVFAKTSALAKLYGDGTKIWDGSTNISYNPSERAGLLTRVGMLATGEHLTSPIHKGVFVLRKIACDDVGAPPPISEDDLIVNYTPDMTTRQKVHVLTVENKTNCASCHNKFNPFGYAFEKYDSLGRVQSGGENIYAANGSIAKKVPVDFSTTVRFGGQDHNISSPEELSDKLAASPVPNACYTKNLFEYFKGRAADLKNDGCDLLEINKKLSAAEGGNMQEAFKAFMSHKGFRYKKIN